MQIAIIGAGVLGLTCGVRLRERGHSVTIFAERRTPETTSDRAAAAFTPPVGPLAERVHEWVRVSLRAFEELARTTPGSGVDVALFRALSREPLTALPAWAADVQGFQRLREFSPHYKEGWAAVLPRIDMTRYMPWLERRFEHELGGAFVSARVLDLAEPFDEGFELVVNATGLGARRLARDEAVVPVRGQVLHVPNVLHLDTVLVDESRGGPPTYVVPFSDHVVIGGSFEVDEWIEECDEPTLVAILERARELLHRTGTQRPERFGRQRLRAAAGLRPGRRVHGHDDCARVEREERQNGRAIVHAYGHGRAGVTLSWGSAKDVVRLCEAEGTAEDGADAPRVEKRSA